MIRYHEVNNENRDFTEYIDCHSGDETVIYKSVQGMDIYMSLYYPKKFDKAAKYPVFVFIHGGGWTSSKTFHDQEFWQGDYLGFLARYYAGKGYISVSIDYRMLQNTGQKDGFGLIDLYQDCLDAVKSLTEHSEEYCLDFERAIVLGESAGGYLAAALTTFPYHEKTMFQKAVLVNPITDLFDSTWNTQVPDKSCNPLLKGKSRDEITRMLSPVLNITVDTPKTLLLHGTADSLVAPSQSYKYHDEMVINGRDVQLHLIEGINHAFLLVEYMKECGKSLEAAALGVSIIDEWLQESDEE